MAVSPRHRAHTTALSCVWMCVCVCVCVSYAGSDIYIQAAHALWRVQVRPSKCELPVCGGFRANLSEALCIRIASPFQNGLSKASVMFYSAKDIDHILCIRTESILHTKSQPLICI